MSILTELKKLTKKKNATVVSQALPDSLDGSGSSGGAKVLTLYLAVKDSMVSGDEAAGYGYFAYKNAECTEEFASRNEAKTALENADVIKLVYDGTFPSGSSFIGVGAGVYYPVNWQDLNTEKVNGVIVSFSEYSASGIAFLYPYPLA